MSEFTEQSRDSLTKCKEKEFGHQKLQTISRKTFTDRRICRTFAKLVENKTKSYGLEFKIEDNVHNNEN